LDVRRPVKIKISCLKLQDKFRSSGKTLLWFKDQNEEKSKLQQMVIAFPMFASVSRRPTVVVIFLLAAIIYKERLRIFYPGSLPDRSLPDVPLPPGKMEGCPFIGSVSGYSNLNKFFSRLSAKVGSRRIWKTYFFGQPSAILSGSSNINAMLNEEFSSKGVSQVTEFGNSKELFGTESMSGVSNRKEYNLMRKLVGKSMTSKALREAIPSLQKASEKSVQEIVCAPGGVVTMSNICKNLTLDIAWRQIIGLSLKDDEVERFLEAVDLWLSQFTSYIIAFLPVQLLRLTRGYKAKKYIVSLIEEKIDSLEKNGPDGSTLSAMVFASDSEENNERRHLTRQQVIDNTLFLIAAGSETSSNTLTNAMLLLGLHPNVFQKMVAEQNLLISKNGDILTKQKIDQECPYLDSVIKEVMRLLPISGGGARNVDETIIIDQKQIPKGWLAWYSIALTHEQDPITYKEDLSHMDIYKGFKPERWLHESTCPTTEFIPFGAGARFCLGYALAMTEMKVFLAILARNVQFKLLNQTDNIEWKEGVIITPKDGVLIQAQPAVTDDNLKWNGELHQHEQKFAKLYEEFSSTDNAKIDELNDARF
jgi:cytochrome P450